MTDIEVDPFTQMAQQLPQETETVIVGNGPSALILSYILHGHIPFYSTSRPHPDPIIRQKLFDSPCLLDVDVADLTAHFSASRISYSTQALPVNVLLDTLIRPLADTEPGRFESCVQWRYEPEKSIPHIVLGNTAHAGGQWSDNPVDASWDIGTLSYAEMLSLPGYGFEQYYQEVHQRPPTEFYRPTRREVAQYVAIYPTIVRIEEAVYNSTAVGNISRVKEGFLIGSHNITCKNLVLGSGIFSHLIPPRPLLRCMVEPPPPMVWREAAPVLVIGSGFTAADIILSTLPNRKVVHIYKWSPDQHPSPLSACHRQAYPEYASVYRRMKLGATRSPTAKGVSMRDTIYEGFPNTVVTRVRRTDHSFIVDLQTHDGEAYQREIANLEYAIGRRGSLSYLDKELAAEILGPNANPMVQISGQTLRAKMEYNLMITPSVYAIGSLTGDSLIRFALGGCLFAAREIMKGTEHSRGLSDRIQAISRCHLITPPKSPQQEVSDEDYDLPDENGHFGMTYSETPVSPLSEDMHPGLWRGSSPVVA